MKTVLDLTLKPSQYIERQLGLLLILRPTGWVIKEAGPDIFMFSSDYPHVEGENPLARFEKSIKDISSRAQIKIFRANFETLMGSASNNEAFKFLYRITNLSSDKTLC